MGDESSVVYYVEGQELNVTLAINQLSGLAVDPTEVYKNLLMMQSRGKSLYGDLAERGRDVDSSIERLRAALYLEFGSKDESNPLVAKQNRITNEAISSMILCQPSYISLENKQADIKNAKVKVWNYVEAVEAAIRFVLAYMSAPHDYDLGELNGADNLEDVKLEARKLWGGSSDD
jgi:hypothetical protein